MPNGIMERLRRLNRLRLERRAERIVEQRGEDPDYERWVARHDSVTSRHWADLRERADRLHTAPLLSVLMPVFNPNPEWLDKAIDSVLRQAYQQWELCMADDCSTDPRVLAVLERHARQDPRIRVEYRRQNGHIAHASNTALDMARGAFVALLDHDDVLPPHALLCVAEAIVAHPEVDLLYSDEDKIDEDGRRRDAYFKPDWNLELFRGHNMFSHLGVYRTSLVRQVGGFRVGFEGSQDYDLALRCVDASSPDRIVHIPHVLYHWRIHKHSTSTGSFAKPYALEAGARALQQHFQRRGIACDVVPDARGWYSVGYPLAQPPPRVQVIVVDSGSKRALRKCLGALARTDHPNHCVAVASGRHLVRACNQLAADSDAEFLVFLDSHCRVHDPKWLTRLVSHAAQPGVGAVGPKLVSRHSRIVGSAAIAGMQGSYAAFGEGVREDGDGYCARARLAQDVTILDHGCLVVRRATFLAALSFDPRYRDLSAATVDLTLRIATHGVTNRWVPTVALKIGPASWPTRVSKALHQRRERARVSREWKLDAFRDPAYNPNLGLTTTRTVFAHPPRVSLAQPLWQAATRD